MLPFEGDGEGVRVLDGEGVGGRGVDRGVSQIGVRGERDDEGGRIR